MISTSDFKIGVCIKLDNKLFQILEFQHVKPGKGGAFVRTKLKNIENNKIIDKTFNAGQKVEGVRIERIKFQFLYNENDNYHFMDLKTYDQIFIDKKLINNPSLLKEGQEVNILHYTQESRYLWCELPIYVNLLVKETHQGVKGDTVTRALKDAILETGALVRVPLFIQEGELLSIDTRDNSYYERISSKQNKI